MDALAVWLAWALLGAYLVVGLVVYERTGMRLGGVLVLPLLLVYALIDLAVVLVFAVATLLTFGLGSWISERTLIYGRRTLYLFLLCGLVATAAAKLALDVGTVGLMLALLPGLFSYNLHREGAYLNGVSAFMIWFSALLAATTLAVWLLRGPDLTILRMPGLAWAPVLGPPAGLPWPLEAGIVGAATVAAASQAEMAGAAE